MLRNLGVLVVEHPGTAGFDNAMRGIEPDAAILIGSGVTPRVKKGQSIDAFVEVKRQTQEGSVIDKIDSTIHRYAALSDQTGIPAVILHDMDPDRIGADVLDYLERLAEIHLVGFMALESVTTDGLRAVLRDLVDQRASRLLSDKEAQRVLASLGRHGAAALVRHLLKVPVETSVDEFDALMS